MIVWTKFERNLKIAKVYLNGQLIHYINNSPYSPESPLTVIHSRVSFKFHQMFRAAQIMYSIK